MSLINWLDFSMEENWLLMAYFKTGNKNGINEKEERKECFNVSFGSAKYRAYNRGLS